jgi:hypothetical protein
MITNSPVLTTAGKALKAKIDAGCGTVPLKITRIVTKSAADPDPLNPTAANEQQTYKIISRDHSADHAWIIGEITNAADHTAEPAVPAWQTPYSIAQINFYAIDPVLGTEVIFRVLIPEPMPPMPAHSEREHVMEHTFDFAVGNASEVIINIDPSALRKHTGNMITSAEGVHGIRKFEDSLQHKDEQGVWQTIKTGSTSPPFAAGEAELTTSPENISIEAITTLGGENAYTLTLESALARYSHGMMLFIRFHTANTSVTPTINVNSRGGIPIRKAGGGVLAEGGIGANSTFLCEIFESPQGQFELRMIRHEINPFTFTGGLSNVYDVVSPVPLTGYKPGFRYVVRFDKANTVGGERVINNLTPALTMNIDGVGRLPVLNNNGLSPSVGEIPENSAFIVETRPNSHIRIIERVDDSHRFAAKTETESAIADINSRISTLSTVVTGVMSANGTLILGFRPSCVIVMARTSVSESNNSASTAGTQWVPWGRFISMAVSGTNGDSWHPSSPQLPTAHSTIVMTNTGFTVSNMFGGIARTSTGTSLGVEVFTVSATNTLRYVAIR